MPDIDPLSQLQIQRQIRDLIDEASENTTNHAIAAEEAYDAERSFELAMARARLKAKGTVPQRQDTALLECEEHYDRHMAAKAVLKAAEQQGRNVRSSLEACRTLAADIRDAVVHATGQGG